MKLIPKYKNITNVKNDIYLKSDAIFEKIIFLMKYLEIESVKVNFNETTIHLKEYTAYNIFVTIEGSILFIIGDNEDADKYILVESYKDVLSSNSHIIEKYKERFYVRLLEIINELEERVVKYENLAETARDTTIYKYENELLIERVR